MADYNIELEELRAKKIEALNNYLSALDNINNALKSVGFIDAKYFDILKKLKDEWVSANVAFVNYLGVNKSQVNGKEN